MLATGEILDTLKFLSLFQQGKDIKWIGDAGSPVSKTPFLSLFQQGKDISKTIRGNNGGERGCLLVSIPFSAGQRLKGF